MFPPLILSLNSLIFWDQDTEEVYNISEIALWGCCLVYMLSFSPGIHMMSGWWVNSLPHLGSGQWIICSLWPLLKRPGVWSLDKGNAWSLKLSHLLLQNRMSALIFTSAANPLRFSITLHLDLNLEFPTHSYHCDVPLNRDLYWDLLCCDFLASMLMLISKLPFISLQNCLGTSRFLLQYAPAMRKQLLFCLTYHAFFFPHPWLPHINKGLLSEAFNLSSSDVPKFFPKLSAH